jgi:integrase
MGTLATQGFQQLQLEPTPFGYSASLWFNATRGQYAVLTRGVSKTNRQSRVEKFTERHHAEAFLARVVRGEDSPYERKAVLRVDDAVDLARALVERETPTRELPSLPLLFAIDRVKSKSRDSQARDYLSTAHGCLRLLTSLQALPSARAPLEWRTWGKAAALVLMKTPLSSGDTVAYDTAKSRMAFFCRALQALVDYGHLFPDGAAYSAAALQALNAAKDARKHSLARVTRRRETYRPLSADEVRALVAGLPDLQRRVYVLKTLFGFRPSESFALRSKHIFDGKVQLALVVTKTTDELGQAPDLAPVHAPLFLRFLCRVEEAFQLTLPHFEGVFPKGSDMCLRRLRTVAACHVLYATRDINAVKERCGHQTLEMAHGHYARYVSAIGVPAGVTPEAYYGIEGGIWLDDSTELAKDDNAWDRFLLSLVFDLVLPELPTRECRALLESEAGVAPKVQAVAARRVFAAS